MLSTAALLKRLPLSSGRQISFFPVITITDFVAQFSGDAQYPGIGYAQSQVEKGVHKITFPGLRTEHCAQIDWQGCFTLLAVPYNVLTILLITLLAVV